MEYVLLASDFGNLNTYMSSRKVGPTASVESVGVDVSAGSLQNRIADSKPTLTNGVWTANDTYVPADSNTIVPWLTGALGMTGRYAVALFGGRIYRSHKGLGAFPSDLRGIQYTSDIGGGATPTLPTWDFFGLFQPGEPAFAVASTGTGSGTKLNAGTYTYYCTFYNAMGQESSPASATVTLSTANYVSVTLPKAYTKCTTTGGGTSLTNVASISRLRLGMRLTGTNIPANTYVTAIDTVNSTATLSQAVTGSGTANDVLIWDAQVVGTRVYRLGDGITVPLLVQQTALGTASFTDNVANKNLGAAITTQGTADIANNLTDVCISPSGVLVCTKDYADIVYMSVVTPSIYDPAKVIKAPAQPLTTIYALNRFICPTTRGAFTVTIDDAILGLPIVQTIDDTEPTGVSYLTYAVDIGGAVWWNTTKGIVQTDGNTIETVTRYTLAKEDVALFQECYGAEFFNNEYVALLKDKNGVSLYRYSRANGWTVVTNNILTSGAAAKALGFHVNNSCLIYTGNAGDSPAAVRRLDYGYTRATGGKYKTGEWLGEKMSALKKFRKVSLLYNGSVSVEVYVDGFLVGQALTGVNDTMTRRSWWLPAGTKGRTLALRITLNTAETAVQEMGVWVGEQRGAMP